MVRAFTLAVIGCWLGVISVTYADVGLVPTPVLTSARVSASVAYDPASFTYSYSYTATNQAGNTGKIWDFKIDVSADQSINDMSYNTFGLTMPMGSGRISFSDLLSRLLTLNANVSTPTPMTAAGVVPFGQDAPPGWNGGLGLDSYASFSTGDGAPTIDPGSSMGGFRLVSFGVPTIREALLIPLWMHVVDDHDAVSDADVAAAGQIERDIIFRTATLGPSEVGYGSFAHWNQLRDDIAKAIQLGWISDQTFANGVTTQLASARQALDAQDFYTARDRLQTLLATINQSTAAQRTTEAAGLLQLNVQSLIDYTTGTNQIEPQVTLSLQSATLPVGGQQRLTFTVIDLANGSQPLAGVPVSIRVESGPNAGELANTYTDAQGTVIVTYTGTQPGTDSVIGSAIFYGGEVTYDDTTSVLWTGGSDLAVPLFIPPLLVTAGGRTFYVTEQTQNIGNVATPPTVTRYFISPDQNFGSGTVRTVGERNIPALQPDQSSAIKQQVLVIPGDLPDGTYFLAACADASSAVVELDENNNCSFSKVQGRQSFFVPIDTPNHPPVCSQAFPSIATLWPPNHKLASVAILGVTDPEGDPVSILVTGITQDEPVNGLGDGDTSPDGFGVGTSQAVLRAERSGTGNGRVYVVSFSASDGKGGTCTGKVGIGVPHDKGAGSIPIDDGQAYDSTKF